MKLLYFDPVSPKHFCQEFVDTIQRVKLPGTEVHLVNLNFHQFQNIGNLEHEFTNAFVLTETLNAVHLAKNEGFDAFVIGCYLDPGLQAAKEISGDMFVVGPCQSSVELAVNISDSFSIILNRKKIKEQVDKNITTYGFKKQLASYRFLNLKVEQLEQMEASTLAVLKTEAQDAIQNNNAEALILGCTVGNLYFKMLQAEFQVPIIDPIVTSILKAESLVRGQQTMQIKYPRHGTFEAPSIDAIEQLLQPDYSFKNRTIIK